MGWITYRKKRNTFYYRYRVFVAGKWCEKSINLRTDSQEIAEKLKVQFDEMLHQGRSPAKLKNATLADYATLLIEEKRYRKISTAHLENYRIVFQKKP